MRLILSSILCLSLALPASAKPPLREVAEIDDGLMAIAIADEIRKTCDGIGARMIRALTQIRELEKRARALGYSDDEINAYVKSEDEKKRMRKKAEAYLASQGVNPKDEDSLCRYGREQIASGGPVGYYLR